MDTIFPSAVTYKVNAKADGIPLDDFSFVNINTKIRPYFDGTVSDDPDVTALMVFLKDSAGEIAGWKVIYTLEPDYDAFIDGFHETSTSDNFLGITGSSFQDTPNDSYQSTPGSDQNGSSHNTFSDSSEDSSNGSFQNTSGGSFQGTSSDSFQGTSSGSLQNVPTGGSQSTSSDDFYNTSNDGFQSAPASSSQSTSSSDLQGNFQSNPSGNSQNTSGNNSQSASTGSSESVFNGSFQSTLFGRFQGSRYQGTLSGNSLETGNTFQDAPTGSFQGDSSNTYSGSLQNTGQESEQLMDFSDNNLVNDVYAREDLFDDKISLNENIPEDSSTAEEPPEAENLFALWNFPPGIESQPVPVFINGEEYIIKVNSLDADLPYFPIPSHIPMGRYTLVYQVMSANQILYKTESAIFYLSDVNFSFEGISVHQGGIPVSSQLISRRAVIMLEAKLNYDSRLDPYIVWYSGRRVISEGRFSQGAGIFLWQAPENIGFFSIRAEVFPVSSRQGLTGYFKDISLLVSSKKPDIHLLSEDTQDVLHWYVFEGNLTDYNMKDSAELAIKPKGDISVNWMPANGTYGLAAGYGNAYVLPEVIFTNEENEKNEEEEENEESEGWKILCRFKPLDDGIIFSAQFGPLFDVKLNLYKKGNDLILTLVSPFNTVSSAIDISETVSFLTVEMDFYVLSDFLFAGFNVFRDFAGQKKPEPQLISLNVNLGDKYRILLGSEFVNAPNSESGSVPVKKTVFTAVWDEFALLTIPVPELVLTAAADMYLEIQSSEDESSDAEEPIEKKYAAEALSEADKAPEGYELDESFKSETLDEADNLVLDTVYGTEY